ncbi:cytochrome P450 [Gloeophyllum trabeum ATCC 11539]|uniref:Cytochrome P450 n=1 Tax=Gloeophyllum trabeum (strain ATCC 11539 / FP-39264 / Madison 617) TaxID=670483 RepID=S7QG42_GLOTA|nr:cytochrome P450 [Gloeophyllum trabeum ATCC 11539]EPQ58851.1 cytochrome P450 [Gloeophyllum trabeum ATCC 11539]
MNAYIDTLLSPLSTPRNLCYAALSCTFVYVIVNAIYQLAFSPLNTIPGPWYAAVSDFWLTTHVVRLQQCKIVQRLFDQYGPVVRVGPNKIVFRDITTMKRVYSVHKFDKSPYYKSLLTNNNDHAMTTLEHARHVARRKGYASHYTTANLSLFQPEMHHLTLKLVSILENLGGKSALDCLTLFRQLMVDVVCASSFDHEAGALANWTTESEDALSTAINDFPKRGILRSAVPTWAWKLVCSIPNKRLRQLCDSDKIMAEYVSDRVYETRSRLALRNAGQEDSDRLSLLRRLLEYRIADSPMSDEDVISECMGHLIAGSDTTSTTLSYLCWELSRRDDIVAKLREELDAAMPDNTAIPDISVLQKLPYLNAFLKEGFRLYGAAPSLLERVVPSSTGKKGEMNEVFDLMGYGLPSGTVVATQAWSMHREPSIFPSPESFLPERWLETVTSTEDLTRMNQHLMAFGTGTRVCGGQNLAQFMLRIVVAAIASNFTVVAPAETSEKSMDMRDSFVIFPASMKCKLAFLPRKH